MIIEKWEKTKGAGSTGTRHTLGIMAATGTPDKGPGSWPSIVAVPAGFEEVRPENAVPPCLDLSSRTRRTRRRVEEALRHSEAGVIFALAAVLGVKTD
jgi:hypothetical protein